MCRLHLLYSELSKRVRGFAPELLALSSHVTGCDLLPCTERVEGDRGGSSWGEMRAGVCMESMEWSHDRLIDELLPAHGYFCFCKQVDKEKYFVPGVSDYQVFVSSSHLSDDTGGTFFLFVCWTVRPVGATLIRCMLESVTKNASFLRLK